MTTYYRGHGVLITDRVFLICSGSRRIPINQMRDPHVFLSGGRFPWIPSVHELRATYDGMEVVLFRTSCPTVFGQVRRALLRALERRRARWEAVYGDD